MTKKTINVIIVLHQARTALLNKNLSEEDEKKLDVIKRINIISCIGIASTTAENLYYEQVDTNKFNLNEFGEA